MLLSDPHLSILDFNPIGIYSLPTNHLYYYCKGLIDRESRFRRIRLD